MQTYTTQFSHVFVTTTVRHHFDLLVSDSTKNGKTTFVKKLLSNVQVMSDPPPEDIKYFYSEYQNTKLVPEIEFVEGVRDAIFDSMNPKTRNLYIFDDMMGEQDAVIGKLFTKKSHHDNLSVIYIVHNLLHQAKIIVQFHYKRQLYCVNKESQRCKSGYSFR